MDMSAFKHSNRNKRQPELRALLARIASRQAVSPTARAAMVTPYSDPLTAGDAKAIDQLMVSAPSNWRNAAAPTSFNTGIAEALLTRAKGS
jgi:hypothetical protein